MRILFCGQSSYPSSNSATANRYRAIADAMSAENAEVVFVNRHGIFPSDMDVVVGAKHRCVWPTGVVRSGSFAVRTLKKLIALPNEMRAILRLDSERHVEFINVYTQYFLDLLFYFFIAKIIRATCIIHVVELRSSFQDRSFFLKVNDWFFERFSPVLFSKFIAISSKTAEIVKRPGYVADVLVVPPLCDFSAIKAMDSRRIRDGQYFLYCASLEYEDVAWFIIQSYLSASVVGVDLVMVLSGSLSDRIEKAVVAASGRITIYSGIPYADLLSLYKGAVALLIPLRDCIQDSARFPQKISEYLASGRPIVTTKNGEIPFYFKNEENALIAEHYDVAEFAERMECVTYIGTRLNDIASRGHQLGLQKFDVAAYSDCVKRYLQK